jgi:hypothetical protein
MQGHVHAELQQSAVNHSTKPALSNSILNCVKEFYFKVKELVTSCDSSSSQFDLASVSPSLNESYIDEKQLQSSMAATFKFLQHSNKSGRNEAARLDFDDLANSDEKFSLLALLYVNMFDAAAVHDGLRQCRFETDDEFGAFINCEPCLSLHDPYFFYMVYKKRMDSQLSELCQSGAIAEACLRLKVIAFVHAMLGVLQHPASTLSKAYAAQNTDNMVLGMIRLELGEQRLFEESSMRSVSSSASFLSGSPVIGLDSNLGHLTTDVSPILRDSADASRRSINDMYAFSSSEIVQWSSQIIGFLTSNI